MNAAPVSPLSAFDEKGDALLALRDVVALDFADRAVPAAVAEKVGLRFRAFQLNQNLPGGGNRVVFIPGEFDGQATSVVKARKYGRVSRETLNAGSAINPREIGSWEQPFTLSIWASPSPGQNDNEGLNLANARRLLEEVLRGCLNFRAQDGTSAQGSIHWGNVLINSPPNDNAFGAELLVQAVLLTPFYDISYDYVQPKLVQATELTT